MSLGRSPSGAVPDIVASYRPLWRVKGVLALGIVAEVVAYLLVLTHVMGGWWLVLATGVIAVALPAIGRAVGPTPSAPPPPPPPRLVPTCRSAYAPRHRWPCRSTA